jgi:7-cyano-7-deazaguanine synthase
MSEIKSSVLLASGGLDSTTLAFWLRNKGIPFVPLFVDYGQHCAETEYDTLRSVMWADARDRICRVNVADIYRGTSSRLISEPDLWKDSMEGDTLYLPYRNLLLLSIGAAFAQSHGYAGLYAAFINSNHAKEIDCSAEFFSRLGGMLADYGTVTVEMPFREFSKTEVASIGVELNVPIAATFSCQAASKVPCGACPNCVDRLNALKELR